MTSDAASALPHLIFTRTLDAPRALVFTAAAMNQAGEAYLEVHNTVTFAEHEGKTTLTLTARVVMARPEATESLSGMEIGWNQSLERLVAHVGEMAR